MSKKLKAIRMASKILEAFCLVHRNEAEKPSNKAMDDRETLAVLSMLTDDTLDLQEELGIDPRKMFPGRDLTGMDHILILSALAGVDRKLMRDAFGLSEKELAEWSRKWNFHTTNN